MADSLIIISHCLTWSRRKVKWLRLMQSPLCLANHALVQLYVTVLARTFAVVRGVLVLPKGHGARI